MTTLAIAAAHSGKTAKDRLAEGEEMLSDYVLGMRGSALSEKYGLSPATVYRRLDAAIKARIAPTVDAYREAQNALLDDLMARWSKQERVADEMIHQAIEAEDLGGMERGLRLRETALNGYLRVAERRAKLMGLDQPAKAEVSVTVTTGLDSRIEEMVSEMERLDA